MTVSLDPSGRPRFGCIGNTPEAYLSAHTSHDRGQRCPVMQWLRTQQRPTIYDRSTYVRADAVDLWEEQASFGYCTGVAVALHLPGERHFALGIDREEPIPAGDEQRMRLMADLLLLASLTVDDAFASMIECGPERAPVPALTRRELQVLQWTVEGKSSWAVGEILHLGEGTVNFHIRNAMRKLEASSKHVAALRALRLGLIRA